MKKSTTGRRRRLRASDFPPEVQERILEFRNAISSRARENPKLETLERGDFGECLTREDGHPISRPAWLMPDFALMAVPHPGDGELYWFIFPRDPEFRGLPLAVLCRDAEQALFVADSIDSLVIGMARAAIGDRFKVRDLMSNEVAVKLCNYIARAYGAVPIGPWREPRE